MKANDIITIERKTSFTREAVREAIRAVYEAKPSTLKHKKRAAKKPKSVLTAK
jgi:hypothetical protein